ncbi:MAG TPA: glycosyltransferase [Nitrososphaeraceae archaeon]|nr:glycosyltransferase [Nitrososphaeraceae archaeon]
MRVLHVSHESLPDWRVEKSALTGLKLGYRVSFAGKPGNNANRTKFAEIYEIEWNSKARLGVPYYWQQVKKQLQKILKQEAPDIVHSHNLYSAKLISELGVPFVFDDHEYWSMSSKILLEMDYRPFQLSIRTQGRTEPDRSRVSIGSRLNKIRRRTLDRYAIHLWTKWEKELISTAPVIVVSKTIARDYQHHLNARTYLVPNYPIISEVEAIGSPTYQTQVDCIYSGGDGNDRVMYPQRQMDGLFDLFEREKRFPLTIAGWSDASSTYLRFLGFLSRPEMFAEMSRHTVGLLPWKKHWAHYYTNPNKPYEYAHSGLAVACTSSIQPVIESLQGCCIRFDNYSDLMNKLNHLQQHPEELYNLRKRTRELARQELTWEKHENQIISAYKAC